MQEGRAEGPLRLLWRQINNPLIYVLLGSAAVAIVMGKAVDGLVILGVVALNTVIGFVQEHWAGKAIEALLSMVPDETTVLRNGERASIPADELVPRDVVMLASGERVPADMRLLAVRNLRVDEAPLTGESVTVSKQTEPLPEDTPLADQRSMVFSGTLVAYGTATAVVVGTGEDAELGRISSMLRETTDIETPLTRRLATVGKWLTGAIMVVAVSLFGVGLLRGYPLVDATLAAITLAVAAIPEGLPAIITIALAIGVRRMARRRAIIRRLPAVETLGSATVICTDKTGTLTRGEMTVQELWTPLGSYRLGGVGYTPEGELSKDGQRIESPPTDVSELLLAGALCNDAALHHEGDAWWVTGDPTEGALVAAAAKAGIDPQEIRRHPLRVRTAVHGDVARDGRGRADHLPERRSGGGDRSLRGGGRRGFPGARDAPGRTIGGGRDAGSGARRWRNSPTETSRAVSRSSDCKA